MNQTRSVSDNLVEFLNDQSMLSDLCSVVMRPEARGKFLLSLASTYTSDVPGISAAGLTPSSRRLTPALDAEILLAQGSFTSKKIPHSPGGGISPVVITRACAALLNWDISVVNCGVFHPPQVEVITAGQRVAKCLSTGEAQNLDDVEALFRRGLDMGKQFHNDFDYLVLGECVPGGTTTALALLTLLGYEVGGLLSSSLPVANHLLRWQLIETGLTKLKIGSESIAANPLEAVAAVGDSMQPFVAGLMCSASQFMPVFLAGGSQMLAVHKLGQLLNRKRLGIEERMRAGVFSTKWVAHDTSADAVKLSKMLDVPFACSSVSFANSSKEAFRLYEDGHVKEGVGAGAALAIATLSLSLTEEQLVSEIDKVYDILVSEDY
jgi:uncharacterized protein (TIGR00303 family)